MKPLREEIDPAGSGTGDGTQPPATAGAAGEQPPAPQGATPSPAGGLTISSDLARSTPEFRAQAGETRAQARRAGELEAENKRLREEAASSRAAAEAERTASQAAEIRTALGEDGFAEYTRIAQLSQDDPVAAAKAMMELGARVKNVQSPAAPAPVPMAPGSSTTGATNFGTRGVSASAPLGAPGNDPLSVLDQIGNEAQAQYDEDVKQVQARDSRWTGRNFTRAVANLLQGSYARRIAERVREDQGQNAYAGLLRRR